jgi:3-oxoacyl-[acyl-carrier-protein] synthase-3
MALEVRIVMEELGLENSDIDLVIPHQANERIIQSLANHLGVPMEQVALNIGSYGNTSAATIPVAMCEALEEGRIRPGSNVLLAAFGAGLTRGAGLVRWGERTTPLGESDAELPPCDQTALEIMSEAIKRTG